jgi:hypothetical protein
MRRSRALIAPLLASAAATLLSGCGPEMQRCVDQYNHVVDPKFCNLPPNQSNNGIPTGYHYYYGGGGSYVYGSTANGGSLTPEAGTSYSLTKGTSRGGFGSSFSGGDGDAGGGHGGGAGE